MASQLSQPVSSTSAATLSCAASTSARRKPKVRRSSGLRVATQAATSASASAPASVSMWPASESRASEPDQSPPTVSATMMVAVSASESPSRRTLVPSPGVGVGRPAVGVVVMVATGRVAQVRAARHRA